MGQTINKLQAMAMHGEAEGGSEVIQTVIVIGFAVGLGAALMALQGVFNTSIESAGTNVNNLFGKITAGKPN